ncbi:hypothetical protein CB1_000296008 [Camelus ferus]|nr:hypothetical protein CB1_000296008 [Camelus ferus]
MPLPGDLAGAPEEGGDQEGGLGLLELPPEVSSSAGFVLRIQDLVKRVSGRGSLMQRPRCPGDEAHTPHEGSALSPLASACYGGSDLDPKALRRASVIGALFFLDAGKTS